MDFMKLNLSSFEKALINLNEAIKKFKEDTTNKFVRDSVIVIGSKAKGTTKECVNLDLAID
jgi:hypothetical protein